MFILTVLKKRFLNVFKIGKRFGIFNNFNNAARIFRINNTVINYINTNVGKNKNLGTANIFQVKFTAKLGAENVIQLNNKS